jgi:signal transduction histidine kinase
VQEQLSNILKHAKATSTTISLTKEENEIILLVSDNGKRCELLKETNEVGIIKYIEPDENIWRKSYHCLKT